jgi:hypothetical protein
MAEVTLESLHSDLIALRADIKIDLVRLEAKIDGKPSLMAMFTAVLITVFGLFGVMASTVATLHTLEMLR